MHPYFMDFPPLSMLDSPHARRREHLNKRQSQPPPGVISFYPATHPTEPFTEGYRPEILPQKAPHLTVLEMTSPEQFKHCHQLLRTSLPTDTDAVRDIMPQSNGFVHTVLQAYNHHRGLILRPDDVWIAILTQSSFFVHSHAEQLRAKFVAHEGKEKLVVTSGANRHNANFAQNGGVNTHSDWIMPNFSTTTDVDRTVYAMTMMATMKDYAFRLRCGTPRVTLLSEKRDWEAILERLERLKQYGIETIAWYHLLHSPRKPRLLVAHYEGGGSGPTYISGWITAFCVFSGRGVWQGTPLNAECMQKDVALHPANPQSPSVAQFAAVYAACDARRPFLVLHGTPYPRIDNGRVPCGYAHVDVKLDDNGKLFDTVIAVGSVGAQICSIDDLSRNGMRDSVRPVMGYWYFITEKGNWWPPLVTFNFCQSFVK
ncbi:uncharacterized protein EDB91DRAFT_1087012 [Suillus paluster]|uniref:uncharacterized protein n=1 Tax=Suillus paluster TaxID=48578 RepID=UPI001B87A82D|nr:uncharacterized protein EDB91DRAFT_1087012 [Suillus paluster]KAG1725700.1 hypothetical protein EDB91DRAFT_1087012 [Suillus paluster]